eukprot:365844-Chlamydomonas_euryale.AAC.14
MLVGGGTAVVYSARDVHTGGVAALKVMYGPEQVPLKVVKREVSQKATRCGRCGVCETCTRFNAACAGVGMKSNTGVGIKLNAGVRPNEMQASEPNQMQALCGRCVEDEMDKGG